MTVLIVDEDEYTRRFLPHDCRRLGCFVEVAASASAAGDCLAVSIFDCVFVEVEQLGDLDAELSVLGCKRQIAGRAPIIVAMTARVIDVDERGKPYDVGERLTKTGGANLFLPKPIARPVLTHILCEVKTLIAEQPRYRRL